MVNAKSESIFLFSKFYKYFMLTTCMRVCNWRKCSRKVLVLQTTADLTYRVSKSYVPFTCKFPMVMYLVLILHNRCRPKTNCYVFSYDKTCLKLCANFRFFLTVFMEKFQKIRYLNYVRRGIITYFLNRNLNLTLYTRIDEIYNFLLSVVNKFFLFH